MPAPSPQTPCRHEDETLKRKTVACLLVEVNSKEINNENANDWRFFWDDEDKLLDTKLSD